MILIPENELEDLLYVVLTGDRGQIAEPRARDLARAALEVARDATSRLMGVDAEIDGEVYALRLDDLKFIYLSQPIDLEGADT